MEKGYLALVLHAHLPFVRHPEYDEFLEERWFFEALTETYIPLLEMLEGLERDNVDSCFTLNLSPSLCNMIADNLLRERYVKHLDKLIELSEKELDRTRFDSRFQPIALMYYRRFTSTKDKFLNSYSTDLISQFRRHQDAGRLEIITCGATHGFLPLLSLNKDAVRAQIRVGVNSYRKFFLREPLGIWLPECGYFEGLDRLLKDEGIRYFLLETHGVMFARPRPKFGVYSGYYTPNRVALFGRDHESSKSVWSSVDGYPGDYAYREYYRDIGFDLDYDYIRPYISPCGNRVNTGIKYYRISGPFNQKEPYDRKIAMDKAAEHAGNFMFNRQKQVEYLQPTLGRKPIILAPYDAELFGHWWFEGVDWLNFLIRKICYDQDTVKLTTPSRYLKIYPKNQVINPAPSSWGWKGYYEVWLNGSNDWIYPHIHRAQERMAEAAKRNRGAEGVKERVLNQMSRELLLAQSSDWAFMMKTGAFSEYAAKRSITHLHRFYQLNDYLERDVFNYEAIEDIERKDNIFPEINYSAYSNNT
ncbi:MAG: glycoside hydrolase [Candidatus Omnitrophica bacterium CG11_big_fil_rev_8_21_14_0_20_42_13]|uniref:Glycoside hydrolase n=1 Tax=Candidatus Ghiorseimicrobium undicola TaxID=1974746 RepID=A0A2H0LXJ2_9BACT|nr:MAG: glycoside hydrolase [Candidatus Omnitrophica bacterium CG11_big_fil_rev_8_21_14_0_20_42_13]